MIPLGLYGAARPVASGGWTPLDIGARFWWDASDSSTFTESGGGISQWDDKSGNGSHLVSVGASHPTVATWNGKSVVSFGGSAFFSVMGLPADWKFMHDGTPNLIGVVLNKTATGNYGVFSTRQDGGNQPAGQWLYLNDTTLWPIVTNKSGATPFVADVRAAGFFSNGTPFMATYTIDPSQSVGSRTRLFKNANTTPSGVDEGYATPYSSADIHPFFVGSLTNTGGMYRLIGWIAELVIVGGAQATEANRVLLRDYLNAKWGIY